MYLGDRGGEIYCAPGQAGCLDFNITGVEVGSFNNEVSRMSSILHDLFDDPAPGVVNHNGPVWSTAGTCPPATPAPGAPACTPISSAVPAPGISLADDPVALPFGAHLLILRTWLNDPFERGLFLESSIMHAASRVMRTFGVPLGTVCGIYSAHTPGGVCPAAWIAG